MHAAMTTASFLNMVAVLASPRVFAKVEALPSRESLLQQIDAYIEVVAALQSDPRSEGETSLVATLPHARELRAQCVAWLPSSDVPALVMQTARAVLAAFGAPEPLEGWDQFEGYPDEGRPGRE
jgi:hypothetical protein